MGGKYQESCLRNSCGNKLRGIRSHVHRHLLTLDMQDSMLFDRIEVRMIQSYEKIKGSMRRLFYSTARGSNGDEMKKQHA